MDTATYWIEYVIRHGSDSLRSPTVDLPWWQVALLDVYLFLVLVVAALFTLIALAIKLIVSFVKSKFHKHLKTD